MIGIVRRVAVVSAGLLAASLLWVRRVDSPIATAPVVIAQRDIPEGAVIDRAAVTVAQWPVGVAPAGAFTTIDSVAGRVTRVAVFKGEALVPGRLAPDGTGPVAGRSCGPWSDTSVVRDALLRHCTKQRSPKVESVQPPRP